MSATRRAVCLRRSYSAGATSTCVEHSNTSQQPTAPNAAPWCRKCLTESRSTVAPQMHGSTVSLYALLAYKCCRGRPDVVEDAYHTGTHTERQCRPTRKPYTPSSAEVGHQVDSTRDATRRDATRRVVPCLRVHACCRIYSRWRTRYLSCPEHGCRHRILCSLRARLSLRTHACPVRCL